MGVEVRVIWLVFVGCSWITEEELVDRMDDDRDLFAEPADCDDTDPDVNPLADELCNGRDDDCDGQTDEGLDIPTWYLDSDGDRFGDDEVSEVACEPPTASYVDVGGDCDDQDPAVNPTNRWYDDADEDGFGDADTEVQTCAPTSDQVSVGGDCDDQDPALSPGAAELCDPDDVDEDCDGVADDLDDAAEQTTVHYRDADGDGRGDAHGETSLQCDDGGGFVADFSDCDDGEASDEASADCHWIMLDAGRTAICGVRADGTHRCDNGNLPAVAIDEPVAFAALAENQDWSCLVDLDGGVHCAGNLGSEVEDPEGSFVSIGLGSVMGCGVHADGTVSVWQSSSGAVPEGDGWSWVDGQGDQGCTFVDDTGTPTNTRGSSDPVGGWVATLDPVLDLDHGYFKSACAVLADGSLSCVDEGDKGIDQDVPTGSDFVGVTVGYAAACAWDSLGQVSCWGSQVPADPGTETFVDFAVSQSHACGITAQGCTRCWGSSYDETFATCP